MSSNRHILDAAGSAPALTPGEGTISRSLAATASDARLQGLRVLRCTARALASSPGGLRFKAGTRPWLEGLEPGLYLQRAAGHATC